MAPSHSDAIPSLSSDSHHTTCPPEELRFSAWRADTTDENRSEDCHSTALAMVHEPDSPAGSASGQIEGHSPDIPATSTVSKGHSLSDSVASTLSYYSITESKSYEPGAEEYYDFEEESPEVDEGHSTLRMLPSYSSSFLHPGSRFVGKQTSDNSVYRVEVELKYVDMKNSFLCGYLRIQGLTTDNSTMVTYFDGEMIGTKYNFLTRKPEWGSSDKKDIDHWLQFPAFRPLKQAGRKASFSLKNSTQREHIFMRWKEHFLVPDHNSQNLNGASFAGFYYICFNQLTGAISGIYYHADNKKTQKLDLEHVQDMGRLPAMEFR